MLEEFAPRHYGLMHLGLQEYLAALHAASRGEELLDEICERFDDEWWQEVVLLLVGLPGRRVFGPLMARLLGTPALLERADLIRKCLDEAAEVDLEPFLALLEPGVEPQRQAAVLRLLRGRTDPRLRERLEALAKSEHGDVAALAAQMTDELLRQVAPQELYDVFVLNHPEHARQATELAEKLRRRGLRTFAAAEDADWAARSEAILEGTRCMAVPVGASGRAPWEETAARGPESREYPWGGEKPDSSRACFSLDWDEGEPAHVGSCPAGRGPFGTLDQAGNVWEWCRDAWAEDVYVKRAKADDVVDPFVEEGENDIKAVRGGCWYYPAHHLRAAVRFRSKAVDRYDFIGFRVEVSPPST